MLVGVLEGADLAEEEPRLHPLVIGQPLARVYLRPACEDAELAVRQVSVARVGDEVGAEAFGQGDHSRVPLFPAATVVTLR